MCGVWRCHVTLGPAPCHSMACLENRDQTNKTQARLVLFYFALNLMSCSRMFQRSCFFFFFFLSLFMFISFEGILRSWNIYIYIHTTDRNGNFPYLFDNKMPCCLCCFVFHVTKIYGGDCINIPFAEVEVRVRVMWTSKWWKQPGRRKGGRVLCS